MRFQFQATYTTIAERLPSELSLPTQAGDPARLLRNVNGTALTLGSTAGGVCRRKVAGAFDPPSPEPTENQTLVRDPSHPSNVRAVPGQTRPDAPSTDRPPTSTRIRLWSEQHTSGREDTRGHRGLSGDVCRRGSASTSRRQRTSLRSVVHLAAACERTHDKLAGQRAGAAGVGVVVPHALWQVDQAQRSLRVGRHTGSPTEQGAKCACRQL